MAEARLIEVCELLEQRGIAVWISKIGDYAITANHEGMTTGCIDLYDDKLRVAVLETDPNTAANIIAPLKCHYLPDIQHSYVDDDDIEHDTEEADPDGSEGVSCDVCGYTMLNDEDGGWFDWAFGPHGGLVYLPRFNFCINCGCTVELTSVQMDCKRALDSLTENKPFYQREQIKQDARFTK